MAWRPSCSLLTLRPSWRRCSYPWAKVSWAFRLPLPALWSLLSRVSNPSPYPSWNVRFGLPTQSPRQVSSPLVQLAMRRHLEAWCSPFYLDLACRLAVISVMPESMTDGTACLLLAHFQSTLVSNIGSFCSLTALPLPVSWWRKQLYVIENYWSLAIGEFLCGNAVWATPMTVSVILLSPTTSGM